MRKGIKIKASAVFLAWGMIFLHNVIPHNHLHENNSGCSELIHNANPTEDDCSGPLKFKPEPGDINVCHISNFLYHQYSEDSFIYHSGISSVNIIICQTGSFSHKSFNPFIKETYFDSASLRAPPSA